jgi:UvrD/REP helicase N-terminal domain
MAEFKLTEEQVNIIDASLTGGSMAVEAGAGAAKTTSLKEISKAKPKYEKGIYVAYNRAIAGDAKAMFPSNTQCATAHSFAFRAVGVKYKHRLNGPRVTAKQTAAILGINGGVSFSDEHQFGPVKLALLAMGAVTRFCYSDDPMITSRHVPFVPGTEHFFSELAEIVAPYAAKAWADLIREDGRLRFQHDVYLKLWALSNPTLPCDFLMLDEAQDANPVIEGVVKRQDAQVIMVGDSAQQIYAWRGAQDAMSRFRADHRLTLSQSFRFGPAVAEEANKWLELLNAPLRLKGFSEIKSEIVPLDTPKAILCRTNAQVVAEALHAQEADKRVAVVGGTTEIRMFAEAARDLMSNQGTTHPDLTAFKSWGDVQEYVQDDAGSDLKVFVNLIDNYGVETVMDVANKAVDEKYADVIVSTAHKSKGREWSAVRIGSDFREPVNEDGTPADPIKAECMLAYVSVTRAKEQLDRGGLAWIDNYIDNRPEEKSIPKGIRIARERKIKEQQS